MIANAISALFVIVTATGLLTTAYLWKVYLEGDGDGGRSAFLFMLAIGAAVCEGIALALVPLAINRLVGNPPPPYGIIAFTVALFVGLGIPHIYAVYIWLLRRRRGPA